MEKYKWFLIGMNLYVFPPAPVIGDIEGLKKMEAYKVGSLGYNKI